MINVDFLQLDETSLFFLLVSGIALIRERMVVSFLIVGLGSFLKGDVAAVLLASLVIWNRIDASDSQPACPGWLRFKDAISFFCLIVGTAVNTPYREFVLSIGVVGLSYHQQHDRLAIVPALLLTHVLFDQPPFIEIILGAAAFFLLLKEGLRLAKSPHETRVLQWLEIPALVGVLLPIRDYFVIWLQDQTLAILGGIVALIILILVTWSNLKKPDFTAIYRRMQSKGLSIIENSSGFVSGKQSWVSDQPAEVRYSIEAGFDAFFWPVALAALAWIILMVLVKGGM